MTTSYDATKDPYAAAGCGPNTFGLNAVAITPSDTVDLTAYPKAVVVTVAGDLKVLPLKGADGTYITFTSAPCGFIVPFRVRRVQATGTTASCAAIND